MINNEQAEFLHRLDVRIGAISALLENHERYIVSLCVDKKNFENALKNIEKAHKKIYEFIEETDKKIFDFFSKYEEEKGANNEQAD